MVMVMARRQLYKTSAALCAGDADPLQSNGAWFGVLPPDELSKHNATEGSPGGQQLHGGEKGIYLV